MNVPAATPKVVAYAALTGIGLLAAVVFGDGAIVAVPAAPFGLALVLGLLTPVGPLPETHLALDVLRLVEGGQATIASSCARRAGCSAATSCSRFLLRSQPRRRPPGRSASIRAPPC